MTKEEAIEILHRDTTRGAVAKLEYYAGFNGEKVIEQIQEAMDMGAEALEKQIPKKPFLESTKGITPIAIWHCPVCKDEIISNWNRDIANPYCHHCGQAIDFGKE